MKNAKNFIVGIIFIAFGALYAANVLGLLSFNLFFPGWWTLIIILPCLIGLFTEKDKVGNAIFLVLGLILLLNAQGLINFQILIKLIVPISLISYGIYMLGKAGKR